MLVTDSRETQPTLTRTGEILTKFGATFSNLHLEAGNTESSDYLTPPVAGRLQLNCKYQQS